MVDKESFPANNDKLIENLTDLNIKENDKPKITDRNVVKLEAYERLI